MIKSYQFIKLFRSNVTIKIQGNKTHEFRKLYLILLRLNLFFHLHIKTN